MNELNKEFKHLQVDDDEAITVRKLAEKISVGEIKEVVVLCGAGTSVSCGIPDFRSPKTGLYANLQKYKLPYAEAVFDLEYFKETKGKAFYELAKEMWPDNYKPSPTHAFIRMLHDKGILRRCYTQNIDTLEREAGIPPELIIEAHGAFGSSSCINCKKEIDADRVRDEIKSGDVPVYCDDESCGGLVKPDIVFFHEGLPDAFFDNRNKDLKGADLLIILGTSLSVSPFNELINYVTKTTPRLLMNLEVVGTVPSKFAKNGLRLGRTDNSRDYMIQGACDDGVRALCDLIGNNWRNDLENLVKTLKSKTKSTKKSINVSKAFPDMKPAYMDYDWRKKKDY
uniref:NAD-dependent protein deacetylase n=1 Tax=Aplanochytrium stocchinoi TaxID=215587 RepID=A0A7S3PGM1_9STRA|mmetsp:Transcript_15883/g.20359  ORF Transcript_15883/g.20359 Transcript_15883/m.20359 type:complete len:340 (+) Transcript_15883:167-1186(+)|eukprot:CAMPEP_0204827260 /NCGR_PEP_ID=MMETSP1346-20131115/4768_1 /ASSEMBLY_ACC=CAM_ASM_000771 /TAXON_ID=215587 /ORGANISM="Aplanochytrium stocchinoi, Strain GSBS06" /LENGTH=339 /DNA_ID=CAMNT_0051955615 /DNA_START=140 /DNA_END=1159 /DNA_ORIENTATION=-